MEAQEKHNEFILIVIVKENIQTRKNTNNNSYV